MIHTRAFGSFSASLKTQTHGHEQTHTHRNSYLIEYSTRAEAAYQKYVCYFYRSSHCALLAHTLTRTHTIFAKSAIRHRD